MSFAQLQAIWQEAERLGYDGATLFDVLSAPALEPWTALSALTATTERLIAIPLVLSPTHIGTRPSSRRWPPASTSSLVGDSSWA